jgi:hypothetical protein
MIRIGFKEPGAKGDNQAIKLAMEKPNKND